LLASWGVTFEAFDTEAQPVNPFDMDSKYGDVMDVEAVIAEFQRIPAEQ